MLQLAAGSDGGYDDRADPLKLFAYLPRCLQPRTSVYRVPAALLAALLAVMPASAEPRAKQPLAKLLQSAGVLPAETVPDRSRLDASPTRDQQLPLFRAVMERPLDAPYRAGVLAQSYRQAAASPHDLMRLTGAVAGLRVQRPAADALAAHEAALRGAADPLAASLAWMGPMAAPGSDWPRPLPDLTELPDPLRLELALVLSAVSHSHRFLQRAFARLPATVTTELLRRQALDGNLADFEEPDFRRLFGLVEREALLAGMLDLIAAVDRLQRFVATTSSLPSVAWTLDTPMGQIVVDTTGRNNRHRLKNPLLVLDVGGDDQYEFLAPGDNHRISVVVDHLGNDRYVSSAAGADPSSATLGFGILWDTEGNDDYQGGQQAQASVLLGAALLVDGGGTNQFTASAHSQAHAIGGLAVLLSGAGDDQFTAQTHSQGSAGPQGVALLIDPAGNDRYTLSNTPLMRPSPQLPDRNTSMGQGAGRGWRGEFADGRSAAGGIGILLDLAGDDRYTAQVFAQGVGYHEGLGMLVDDGGNDRFQAAWYVMGAGVHNAAGILLKRGNGDDTYEASHEIAIGAANDLSVGIFVDEGGNDRYQVGDLGLGAAHDNSVALFVDGSGDDRYQVVARGCRALGASAMSQWGNLREDLVNLGLFMDLGGRDTYPSHCARAGNDAAWAALRTWPQLNLRSEAGAGLDGQWPMPFSIRPMTTSAAPTKAP